MSAASCSPYRPCAVPTLLLRSILMSLARRHAPRYAAALLAAAALAACQGHSSSGDTALKHDLDAATGDGLALAPRGSQTQVVSALELGEGKANPSGAPARANTGTPAPQRLAARAPATAPRIVERVRIIERVVDPAPEPEPQVAAAPAPAPEPTPAASEPAPVAAPSPGSRRLPTTDAPERGRRRGTWDMGDVVRNAPFPINP
ncbi:hypothetical protein tb265_16690 [Gemmatimonadetes bacterium T265]|nr:hypothetical protein tb265_16690 [Gemmatimonadetes bacterium T265]